MKKSIINFFVVMITLLVIACDNKIDVDTQAKLFNERYEKIQSFELLTNNQKERMAIYTAYSIGLCSEILNSPNMNYIIEKLKHKHPNNNVLQSDEFRRKAIDVKYDQNLDPLGKLTALLSKYDSINIYNMEKK